MKIADFVDDPRVQRHAARLRDHWRSHGPGGKPVSDILDGRKRQYVDLVMEGGGVLGIALVGYTWALERVGIRFLGVGGTSAGAINALALAALDAPDRPKSEKCLRALANLAMFEFVDGDDDARDFVETMVRGAGTVTITWKAMQVLDNLNDDLGLNPGNVFLAWLTKLLESAGVHTVADLEQKMTPPRLFRRDGTPIPRKDWGAKLAVVAADVTTETKVEFPRMAGLYHPRPRSVNPALFVRASMSIPGFFQPLRAPRIPKGDAAAKRWAKSAGYTGTLPDEVLFVDGGVMSNFPIEIFHAKGVPAAPTFGAKIGVDRTTPRVIGKPLELLGAVFDAARHCADYDFLIRHPDYRHLVGFIDTGEHHWLDFFLGPEAKVDLFARGVEAAVDFLVGFDWEAYKEVRRGLARR